MASSDDDGVHVVLELTATLELADSDVAVGEGVNEEAERQSTEQHAGWLRVPAEHV